MAPGKSPSFQFYANDFLSGTLALSLEECGAYVTLLAYQWDHGSVPDGHVARARICRCSAAQAKRVWTAIVGKFQQGPEGAWRNARLESERQKQDAYRQLQRNKGLQSALNRAGNRKATEPQPNTQPKVNREGNREATLLFSSSGTSLKNNEVPRAARSSRFNEWYAVYPKKTGKNTALKAWEKISPDDALVALMFDALKWQRNQPQWTKDGGHYVPNPATYLNQARWEDEPFFTATQPSRSSVPSPEETRRMLEERAAMAGK